MKKRLYQALFLFYQKQMCPEFVLIKAGQHMSRW